MTLSLAGSAPRGKDPVEEKKFETDLLTSSKLIHEQNIVTEEIQNRLNIIADDIAISPLSIMKLQYIQHRANYIQAVLKSDKNFLDLILALHPTPAVGGTPNQLALDTITLLEEEERGHYAAPIGYATDNFSEWAVGLRSVLINKQNLTIFSGCGLTKDSNAEEEWNETENKMSPFFKLLKKEHHK